jgi:hypothetical protein
VTDEPLTFSSASRPLAAAVDEVKLAGGVEPLTYQLAHFERILGWKKILHFDRHGHLDPRHHAEEVRLVLIELEDDGPKSGTTTEVFVDYSLTFDEWLARWDEPPPLRQLAEEKRIEANYPNARKIVIEVDRLGVVR